MTWTNIGVISTLIGLGMLSPSGGQQSTPHTSWRVERIQLVSELSKDDQSFVDEVKDEQASWRSEVIVYEVSAGVGGEIDRRLIVAPRNDAVRIGSLIQVEGQWTILRQSADFAVDSTRPAATVEAVERVELVANR